MVQIFCIFIVRRSFTRMTASRLRNASMTIQELFKEYDIRLRPSFGYEPLLLDIEIRLASFDSISEVNMDYTLTLYLNQYWRDERLVFGNKSDEIILTGDIIDKFWLPDTFFPNDKSAYLHDVTEKNKMIRLCGNGDILYGMRFTSTLACMMDLRRYPLDRQNCTVEVESYGYTQADLIMRWKNGRASILDLDKAQFPQFTILDYDTISYGIYLATGVYQRLSLSFILQRNIGYFLFQTYLPSILIVMLSWVSFWINHEATSARVTLGITTVLTMTTISTGVRSSLPRISYVKAIDIYLLMCFVFVFAALLEYAAVNYLYWGKKAKRRKQKSQREKSRQKAPNNYELVHINADRDSPIIGLYSNTSVNRRKLLITSSDDNRQTNHIIDTQSPRMQPLVRGNPALYPSSYNRNQQPRRTRRFINYLRTRTINIRHSIPHVQDVNDIDRWSRLCFPILFLLFNASYWPYYIVRPQKFT
ncbi:unnamed protein product [Rotaria magnacalcarata]|uniref:Gamma-aminobutyric acid receptor subunit beta n=5 Tax=Rotaria magnacalcarata TaxID=392030 RepID=A0A815RBZ2_9BILA|nr:unnamed protein product [Rotaria magnacalcarata]CAF1625812.1 unnamed protein product [Rotaria magnacalcarata]CAF2037865.1 unnamed protein product [Rotaria magnacalcarata]CAF2066423.1 unnamed protein product [Rotaria magnacalcarata]CAF2123770.1 unnamed protein product [Rotaria magnacalcarata]